MTIHDTLQYGTILAKATEELVVDTVVEMSSKTSVVEWSGARTEREARDSERGELSNKNRNNHAYVGVVVHTSRVVPSWYNVVLSCILMNCE